MAQSFPDAWSAGKGKCKVLLGTEAYYVNDVDERLTVRGSLDQDLDEAIVCFDLETTGLDKETEVITEIGAVVLEHGEVKERFQTFVDPKRPLAPQHHPTHRHHRRDAGGGPQPGGGHPGLSGLCGWAALGGPQRGV